VTVQVSTREGGIPRPPAGEPYTPEHALREAARLGIGVEFSTAPAERNRAGQRRNQGLWPEDLDAGARAALRSQAAGVGAPITSLSSDWVWGFSAYYPTLEGWERGGRLLALDMELAADLGAAVCLIHFARSRATWEQAKRYCAATAEAAARHGVVAAFEGSLWHLTGLGPIDELLRLIEELGHPGLKVYAHPRGPGRACADEILKIGGKRLACVHHTRMEDDVDYDAFFGALKQVGYAGPLVFETGGPEELTRSLEQLRPVLGKHGM